MQKSTFSVNFFIRRTRLGKSGETPIMMRISVDGRYTELSTQRRGLPCGLRQKIADLHTLLQNENSQGFSFFVLSKCVIFPQNL